MCFGVWKKNDNSFEVFNKTLFADHNFWMANSNLQVTWLLSTLEQQGLRLSGPIAANPIYDAMK